MFCRGAARSLAWLALASAVAGCGTSEERVARFAGIAASETIYFSGNEPFWSGETAGGLLSYITPENPGGTRIAVRRFDGNSGLGLTGTMDGAAFDMVVTPGNCADTMADRRYPFVVTVMIAGELREGCAWTDRQPATDTAEPAA